MKHTSTVMEKTRNGVDCEDCLNMYKILESSIENENNSVLTYCDAFVGLTFNGETSNHFDSKETDKSNTIEKYNLGKFLRLMHKYIHSFKKVDEFTGEENIFILLLKLIAIKRKGVNESGKTFYCKLLKDKSRFVQIYQSRGCHSQSLENNQYWGSRQQLRAGKVIADWIDPYSGSLDPVFGVLLCPTAGRTGSGDSRILHRLLFDDSGPMAYHSAIHDAFGYLKTQHDIGPGYNYLSFSTMFSSKSPCAGQFTGLVYWIIRLKKDNENNQLIL